MKYLVTAEEMRRIDNFTTEKIGLSAMTLMERAALAAQVSVDKYCRGPEARSGPEAYFRGPEEQSGRESPVLRRTVLIMAGTGNNGGDGLALARLLSGENFMVEVWIVGDETRASELWMRQRKILEYYPVNFCSKPAGTEYTILVDALFGIGLSRDISGVWQEAVDLFNGLQGWKIALDVPSGVNSDTGRIMGRSSVMADETVAFACCKRGEVLYPGCLAAGKVTVADIGIPEAAFRAEQPEMYALDEEPEALLPKRCPWGNKGTFGKVLLAAGSPGMAGAAVLAAKAAYRAGAGMVRVITSAENRSVIQTAVPEALVGMREEFGSFFDWADVIAVGPGLGKDEQAGRMLEQALKGSSLPLLIDGDGLNLAAERPDIRKMLAKQGRTGRSIVLTPHVGELARLLGKAVPEIQERVADYGRDLAMELQTVVAAKDARTFICKTGEPVCVNLSGSSGLATAGSGDVLAGIISGLMAQGMDACRAACVGAYIHGCRGQTASLLHGEHGCMAGDLI